MKVSMAIVVVLLVGCAASEHLPQVAWHSQREALSILSARAAETPTVTAQGLLTMQRPDGQSVRLDMAMVRDNAHHVRLRAWKFGRAVFDFTLTPQGVWLLMPDDPSIRQRVHDAQDGVTRLADTLSVLDGDLFSRPDTIARDEGKMLVCSAMIGEMHVRCDVERTTLVPRKYVLADNSGVERFALLLSDYKVFGDIPFACNYVATSDMGKITISLNDVELNTELAPGAFVPPKRAEKVR